MSDFEMPYFVDGGGNKGYFKDSTAREQIGDLSHTGFTGDSVEDQLYAAKVLINGNSVKCTAPNNNPALSFTNGIAEISKSDIGASLIISVLAWGGNTSLSLGIRNWVQGKYYICNNTNPSFTGTLDVTFIYI